MLSRSGLQSTLVITLHRSVGGRRALPAEIRELEAAGADAKLAKAIVATISRADAEIATKFHVEAVLNSGRPDHPCPAADRGCPGRLPEAHHLTG